MGNGFLFQAVIYLSAAVICVPIAKRFAMGSVLGYLIAGMLIGPFVLGFIGHEGKDIMHFAEFGVVMMLFLIGLELEPAHLWKIRKQIIGVGLSQVLITTAVVMAIGIAASLLWQSALAIGFAFAMSSTAIVLQSLKEKGLMKEPSGEFSFAVLLFQDIAVIPIPAILPLLVFLPITNSIDTHGAGGIEELPKWLQTGAVLAAVGVIVLVGRYAIVPMLRLIAKTHMRELFTASALLIVVAIALLMQQVGLSPALGTFLAGVILANSEFKHELESDLEPFKGLLLGLFFISVGASIDFNLMYAHAGTVAVLTCAVIFIKAIVLFLIGKKAKLSLDQNLIFAIGLSQVGEFAFVLFSFIGSHNILTQEQTDMMMAVTALSMTISPLLLIVLDKWVLPKVRAAKNEQTTKRADRIEERNNVLLVGFGHFGTTLARFLRANGVVATVLDNSSDQVDLLRKMGFNVFYGDATRVDILEAAGAAEASILIIAIDSPETNLEIVKIVKQHFPNLEIMVRSKNRMDTYELLDEGVENIYREHLDTSIRLGVDVMKKLGYRTYSAFRAGQNFIKYDEAALRTLSKNRKDMKVYISDVREQIALQEELLQSDRQIVPSANDHAWDSKEMRDKILEMDNQKKK
ncbi:monovalent cation:proton antiporter-2 (CPA2) family protein [Cytophaga aurantiaca]|uniref:monovalent cation:proton antiporter-2 (CPA2) family protein n=1 Tax=Cytophaga aurantiaca TaxID=29530 RepID=UPI00036EDAA2|nr:monovalent cation:proton antiporter-2 (CPA2) family protein [Cytophaga aurantiaca]